MDPITHAVAGLAAVALTGEPLAVSNPVVIGCVAGAVIPDLDIIMQFKGDYKYLKNHRGISHSIPMMFVYSGVLTTLLGLFAGSPPGKTFLFVLLGCFSHIALDITNSYGAQIFWPFSKKHVTLDLLLVYDPMIIIMCLITILPYTRSIIPSFLVAGVFVVYLILRYVMKKLAASIALKNLNCRFEPVCFRIMPSMVGFTKWHFILSTGNEKVIGDVSIFSGKIRVIDIKKNIDEDLYKMVMNTPIAVFFGQFTPIFHIECEKKEGSYVFNFVDLRYYIFKDFLHHATAVVNMNYEVVKSLFHPYSKGRNVEV